MKVKLQEVLEALNAYGAELEKVGFKKSTSPTLPERIQQHGIEVSYTPMTDVRDEFLAGICVALQAITAHDDGVVWAEIVRTAGVDAVLNYAANIEPDEWELAGFSKYARNELHRNKPRKQAVLNRLGVAPTLDQARAICEQAGDDALTEVIRERDERENVIDRILDLVLGSDRREWSNLYGYADAIEEVEEVMSALAHTEAASPEIQQRMDLIQAKAICEQAGFSVVPIVFLETIFGMSILGAETPSCAVRWCERIHDTFCLPDSDEYHDHKQPLPKAMLEAAKEVKP